jgi:hypothetical protein
MLMRTTIGPDDAATVGELLRELGQGRSTPEELRDAAIYWSAAIDPDMECADLQTIAWLPPRRQRPPPGSHRRTGPGPLLGRLPGGQDGQLDAGTRSSVGSRPGTASPYRQATTLPPPARPVPRQPPRSAESPGAPGTDRFPHLPAAHRGSGTPGLKPPQLLVRRSRRARVAAAGSGAAVMARTTTIRVAPAAVTWSRLSRSMPPMGEPGPGRVEVGDGLQQGGAGGGAAGLGGRRPDGPGDQVVPRLGGGPGRLAEVVGRAAQEDVVAEEAAAPAQGQGRPGPGGARRPRRPGRRRPGR